MLRITKPYTGIQSEVIVIDPTKKDFGRSVYICRTIGCLNTAIKEKKKIPKMLKISVSSKGVDKVISMLTEYIKIVPPLNRKIREVSV